MAYIVSSIPPFYSNNTSAPSPFYPTYDSPFYSTYNTNTLPSPNSFSSYHSQQPPPVSINIPISTPSPNHFYPIEASTSNLSFSHSHSLSSPNYCTALSNFNGDEDAYWWLLCTEKHFKAIGTSQEGMLPATVSAFAGCARRWLLWWYERHPSATWETFTAAFLWRFKPEFRAVLPLSDDEMEPAEFSCDTEKKLDLPLVVSSKVSAESPKGNLPSLDSVPIVTMATSDSSCYTFQSGISSAIASDLQVIHPNLMLPPPPKPEPEKEEEQRDDELFLPIISTEVVSHGVEIFWAERPPPPPLPEPPDGESPCEPHPPPKPPDRVWISSPLPPKPPDRLTLSLLSSPSLSELPNRDTSPYLQPHTTLVFDPGPPLMAVQGDHVVDGVLQCYKENHTLLFVSPSLDDNNHSKSGPSDHIDAIQSQPCVTSTICELGKEPLVSRHVSYQKSLNALQQPLILQVIDGKQISIDNATHALNKSVPITNNMEKDNYSLLSFMLNLELRHIPCVPNINFFVILHKQPTHSMSCNMLFIHAQPDSGASKIGFFSMTIGMELWDPGEFLSMHMMAKFTWFKQWDPGENFFTTVVSSVLQFKQWDPGKLDLASIFFNLEDKVGVKGNGM